jgi:hypothetical protein
MPGNIRGAVSIGTLPFSLSTQFSELHAVLMNINEYHDGNSHRVSLAVGARRSWKLAKRLDAFHLGLLSDFWDAARSRAFYFYNPTETLPPFSRNPTGTAGRYLVRFASDWEQTNGIARTDTVIELLEVASAQDIGEAL